MGRPKNIEPTIPLAVRVPTALKMAVDLAAMEANTSRSEWLKGAIRRQLELQASNIVPREAKESNEVHDGIM